MHLKSRRGLFSLFVASLLLSSLLPSSLFPVGSGALAQGFGQPHKASFEWAMDRTSYGPDDRVGLAVQVTIEDHWHVNSHTPTYDYLIPTELTFAGLDGEAIAALDAAVVEYPPHTMQSFPFTEEPIAVYDGTFRILAEFDLPEDAAEPAYAFEARLHYQACDDKQCLQPMTVSMPVEFALGESGEAINAEWFADLEASGPVAGVAAVKTGSARAGEESKGLLFFLLMGFIGGIILNAMPCVLPVLSLKIFDLVKSSGESRSQVLMGALATTAGVLVSFWALALASILASQAGAAVGWGMQFQQPGFVAFLVVVVTLFSLNMWGLFEIPMPQRLANAAGGAERQGMARHFMTGLLATLMATPCSAPFLGTAVGFALAQPPLIIVLVFTAVGLGLAFPYLLIGFVPGAIRWMPKPGAWMDTFRGVMGFLLAASAIWLFYVLANQIALEHLAFLQLALLILALCTWLQSRSAKLGTKRLAGVGTLAAAVVVIALAAGAPGRSTAEDLTSKRIDWLAFDEQEAISLSDSGSLVFVDFTADWCLTCKANERLVIETDEVAGAFETHGVVPMKGDWTNRDEVIGEYLARFGRSSVPFYVLYRPGQEPYVFGELLTRQGILDALDEATRVASASGATAGG